MIEIQLALLLTVQLQVLAEAVTFTLVENVPAPTDRLVEESENEQGEAVAPACVMVNVLPATVSVPVRDAVPGLAAMENETVPLPVLLEPAVMLIQLALLVAVQLQVLAEVVTLTLPEFVPAPTERFVLDKENEQDGVPEEDG